LSYSYQWERCDSSGNACTDIAGETDTFYLIQSGDVGATIRIVVTATNPAGTTSATASQTAVVAGAPPSNGILPDISGSPREGKTLTVSSGEWDGTPPFSYSYQWQACDASGANCTDISGATGTSYDVTAGDVGHALQATVTASNSSGSDTASTPATDVVVSAASTVWSEQVAPTFDSLRSVSCPTASQCWAAGDNGAIVATSDGGDTWTTQATGGGAFNAIFCPNASNCYAVGARATIKVTTNGGSTWVTEPSGQVTNPNLNAIACTSASTCVAGGANGTILQTTNTGASWASQVSGAVTQINGIACPSSSHCWAVGNTGTVLTSSNGGSTWSPQVSGTTEDLYSISCPTGSQCWAAGASGSILRTSNSGSSWTAQTSGTSDDLYGIACPTTSRCWTVDGLSGEIFATNDGGSTWTEQLSPAYDYGLSLYGVACPVADQCWAVGDISEILAGANPPVNTAPPAIAGTATDGQTLSADMGTWSGAQPISYSYQWQDCDASGANCSDIASATDSSYSVLPGDVGSTLRVVVNASNSGDSSQLASSVTAVAAEDQAAVATPDLPQYDPALTSDTPVPDLTLSDSQVTTAKQVLAADPRFASILSAAGTDVSTVMPSVAMNSWSNENGTQLLGAFLYVPLPATATIDTDWPLMHYDESEVSSPPWTTGTLHFTASNVTALLVTVELGSNNTVLEIQPDADAAISNLPPTFPSTAQPGGET
jgi:photosystem II stability/assembly factor-like uncharacterized protein